jgi:hypothetical protein
LRQGVKSLQVRKNVKRLAFIGVLALAIGLILAFTIPTAPEQPKIEGHVGISVAHAQPLDPTSGCAACHTQPITVACTECHPSPPTTLNGNIAFPHHDPSAGGPPDDCQSSTCHDGGNDARYVVVLQANHNYCSQCHTMTHSSPG